MTSVMITARKPPTMVYAPVTSAMMMMPKI